MEVFHGLKQKVRQKTRRCWKPLGQALRAPVYAALARRWWRPARPHAGAFFFRFLLGDQRFLPRFLGLTCLAGQGFLDGFEDFAQVGLVLLAGLQLGVAGFYVVIELGQGLLAFLADFVQLVALRVEGGLLVEQLRLLVGYFLFDIGQLPQGFVKPLQLRQARLAQVIVVGEGARKFFRVLLVEQQLEVFLAAALVGGAGLDRDQALLFNACGLEFFFSASSRSSSDSLFFNSFWSS